MTKTKVPPRTSTLDSFMPWAWKRFGIDPGQEVELDLNLSELIRTWGRETGRMGSFRGSLETVRRSPYMENIARPQHSHGRVVQAGRWRISRPAENGAPVFEHPSPAEQAAQAQIPVTEAALRGDGDLAGTLDVERMPSGVLIPPELATHLRSLLGPDDTIRELVRDSLASLKLLLEDIQRMTHEAEQGIQELQELIEP